MTPLYRFAALLGLVAVYFLCCGDFTAAPAVYGRLFMLYMFGAATTLYAKGQEIGTLQPISTRPICIVVGIFIMAASLFWTIVIKGHA